MNKLFSLLVTVFYFNIWSAPQLYSKCNVKVTEPELSSGHFFSKDCKTLYVLPPKVGHMTIRNYQPTGHANSYCSALKDIEETHRSYAKTEERIAKRLLDYAERLTTIDEYLSKNLTPVGKTTEDLEDEFFELVGKQDQLRSSLDGSFKSHVEKLSFYAQREGGEGVFIIENDFSNLIKAYQKANPKLNILRMPLSQSFIKMSDRVYSDNQKLEMAAVIGLSIPGISSMPLLLGASETLKQTQSDSKWDESVDLFSDAISGSIRLSAIGSCGLVQNQIGANFSIEKVKSYISANAFYSYQVQVQRTYKIEFNMQELVQKIHEQTRKNGFFSKKTLNKLVDNRLSTSWVKFYHQADDVRFEYSDEDLKAIKQSLIDRAVKQVISLQLGPQAMLALIEPQGSTVGDATSEALKLCPHLYCQLSSAGLKVLGTLFGKSSAVSELVQKMQGSVVEIENGTKSVLVQGSLTFN